MASNQLVWFRFLGIKQLQNTELLLSVLNLWSQNKVDIFWVIPCYVMMSSALASFLCQLLVLLYVAREENNNKNNKITSVFHEYFILGNWFHEKLCWIINIWCCEPFRKDQVCIRVTHSTSIQNKIQYLSLHCVTKWKNSSLHQWFSRFGRTRNQMLNLM